MEGRCTYFIGNQFINNTIDKIVSDLLLGFCYCLFVLGLACVSDFPLVNAFNLISSGNEPFYPLSIKKFAP